MDLSDNDVELATDFECKVCGELRFILREGYFYCEECGTKQDQIQDVEVDAEKINNDRMLKKQKIKTTKGEKPGLTSWECYNYILHGMVDELLNMGAKEELKLMALQVWAAYLRTLEVAFFNKSHAELPRLGVRYLKRDVEALYNHNTQKRKRTRKSKDDASQASGHSSKRVWRKKKRQLDESAYSKLSQSIASSDNSRSHTSLNSASTGNTTQAIQLNFSKQARKYFKKIMPKKHLEKHSKDVERLMQCHTHKPPARSLRRADHRVNTTNMKNLYAIIAIALNLIEDKIQFSDLVRFISEDHLSAKNVFNYFPENILPYCKQLLQDIDFYLYPDKYADKGLREHVSLLARAICVKEFKTPNLSELARRYVVELNLPPDISTYVTRLMNLLPPKVRTRAQFTYAPFEARAMAYIVYVLKLLFGLDGYKEKLISKSAQKINEKIQVLNGKRKTTHPIYPELFVWSEWVEYIEMRKVIVSQYNSNFCKQFKQCQSTAQLLEEMAEEQRRRAEEEHLLVDTPKTSNTKVQSMKSILQKFLENTQNDTEPQAELIKFSPSLTPAHDYFKRILLYNASANRSITVNIPDYMRVDHTQRSAQAFLHTKTLREFLSVHNMTLKVLPLSCTTDRTYVGVFHVREEYRSGPSRAMLAQKADFDISEEEWLEAITQEPIGEELEFKTELDAYHKSYLKRRQTEAWKRKLSAKSYHPNWFARNHMPTIECDNESTATTMNQDENPANVFSENNMDPIDKYELNWPRRELDNVDIFGNISDDELDNNCDDADTEILKKEILDDDNDAINNDTITFVKSKMDCWMLLGGMYAFKESDKKMLKFKFPRSFFWLLETCAQTINIDWGILYEQLLAIEVMFSYGIENLDNFRNCLRFNYNNPVKDINMLINSYREIW